MSGMVRIRAKAPLCPGPFTMMPSWPDVEVFVVAPDGSETPMTGVKSINFKATESSEPLTCSLTVYLDELDLLLEQDEQ